MILPEKILTDEEREELIKLEDTSNTFNSGVTIKHIFTNRMSKPITISFCRNIVTTALNIIATAGLINNPGAAHEDLNKKCNIFGEDLKTVRNNINFKNTMSFKHYIQDHILQDYVNADWKHIPAKLIHKIRTFGRNSEKSFDTIDEHIFILTIVACIILSFVNNTIAHIAQICIGAIVTYILTYATMTRIQGRKKVGINDKEFYDNIKPNVILLSDQKCLHEGFRNNLKDIENNINCGLTTQDNWFKIHRYNNSLIITLILSFCVLTFSQILMIPHEKLLEYINQETKWYIPSTAIIMILWNIEIGGRSILNRIFSIDEIFFKNKRKNKKILFNGSKRIHSKISNVIILITTFVTTLLVIEAVKTTFGSHFHNYFLS